MLISTVGNKYSACIMSSWSCSEDPSDEGTLLVCTLSMCELHINISVHLDYCHWINHHFFLIGIVCQLIFAQQKWGRLMEVIYCHLTSLSLGLAFLLLVGDRLHKRCLRHGVKMFLLL